MNNIMNKTRKEKTGFLAIDVENAIANSVVMPDCNDILLIEEYLTVNEIIKILRDERNVHLSEAAYSVMASCKSDGLDKELYDETARYRHEAADAIDKVLWRLRDEAERKANADDSFIL